MVLKGTFCQELKMGLKEKIELWSGYHEGTKAFGDLGKEKGKRHSIAR